MKRTRPACLLYVFSPVNRHVLVVLATVMLAAVVAVDVGCSRSRRHLAQRKPAANAPKPARVAPQPKPRQRSSVSTNRQRRTLNAGWASVLSVGTSTSIERSPERHGRIAEIATAAPGVGGDSEPVAAVELEEAADEVIDEVAGATDEPVEAGVDTTDTSDLEVDSVEADEGTEDEDGEEADVAVDEKEGTDEEDEGADDVESDDEEMDEDTEEDGDEALEENDGEEGTDEEDKDGDDEEVDEEAEEDSDEALEEDDGEEGTEEESDGGEERDLDEDEEEEDSEAGGGAFGVMKRAVGLGTGADDDEAEGDESEGDEGDGSDTGREETGAKKPGAKEPVAKAAEEPPVEKSSTSSSKGAPADSKPKPEADAERNLKKPSYAEIIEKTRAAERQHRAEADKLVEKAETLIQHREYGRARSAALKAKQLDPARDAEIERLIKEIVRAEARASRPRGSRSR